MRRTDERKLGPLLEQRWQSEPASDRQAVDAPIRSCFTAYAASDTWASWLIHPVLHRAYPPFGLIARCFISARKLSFDSIAACSS